MKLVYGLTAQIGLGFAVSLFTAPTSNRVQVDPGPIEPPANVYDPVRSREQTPPGFRRLLARDAILPVYNSTFLPATDTDWPGGTLVIGLALEDEAKAYPVSSLNRREMVIEWIGGTPVLVSW